MRSLLQPTLVRRVVIALLCAFSVAWIMLMAVQYIETRSSEIDDAGVNDFIAATADALSSVREPNELRILAIATFKQFNTPWMRDRRSSSVLVQAWDREHHRLVYASDGAEDVSMPQPPAGSSTLLQSVRGEAHVVHVATSQRWALVMGVPRLEERWLLKELGGTLIKYMAIAFPFVLLPVWLAVRQGLRPLQHLSDRIAARSPDDLSALEVDLKYAELRPLVSALDGLMVQLRNKIGREHAFVQDAAHELRTPLAVISAQAHVLAKAADDAARTDAERRMDHAIARASHLVQQLLVLAHIDVLRPLSASEVDVAHLARTEMALLAPAAADRDIELSLQAPDSLKLRLELQAFQSVLHNLLDNAIRYGRQGGQVVVELTQLAGGAGLVLWVADDGPGIPPASRELVFDRFYRGAGHDATGSGLGLAIVKEAAMRLAGTVRLAHGLEGTGCGFTVVIPVAE